jgi:transglutaminase-like putative cysteine protease
MKLLINHETVYRYETPVHYSIQYIRLTPRQDPCQRILDWNIGTPGRSWRQVDAFGNIVHIVSLDRPHDEFRISVHGTVETLLAPGTPMPHDSALPPAAFLVHTRLTTPDAVMEGLVKSAFSPDRTRMEGARSLMASIVKNVEYQTGVTEVYHTASEALAFGKGVCQDHTHIFLACCRLAGIPARYVSGYLDAGDPGHVASHAWADIWLDDAGWISLDITNSSFSDRRYCRLAIGRDYLEASPVRGMRRGGTREKMFVAVQVNTPEDAQQ